MFGNIFGNKGSSGGGNFERQSNLLGKSVFGPFGVSMYSVLQYDCFFAAKIISFYRFRLFVVDLGKMSLRF